MPTSLFVCLLYIGHSQVSPSSAWALKQVFFSLTCCCIITPVSGIGDYYSVVENWEKTRTN